MPQAPILGDTYLVITGAEPVKPTNQNELLPKLDPVFMTAWNQSKYLFPAPWQGNPDIIVAAAVVAYRYKTGSGVTTPTLSSISPTTGTKNVAFTLTANGSNFDANAVIVLAGVDQVTQNLSATQLTASIAASSIPTQGTYAVAVRNADGTISTTQTFTATP
jgi:IPT/TIG domain-containing protein